MKAIEIDGDDMKEILNHLPAGLKKKIMEAIKPSSGIEIVEKFVERYEDDDMRDHVIAHTISNLIRKIGGISTDIIKDRKKEGKKGMSTIEMGFLVVECLRDEAKNIEKALKEHEESCESGDDCGAKHKH